MDIAAEVRRQVAEAMAVEEQKRKDRERGVWLALGSVAFWIFVINNSGPADGADMPEPAPLAGVYIGPAGSLPGRVTDRLTDADTAFCRARADRVLFERRTAVLSSCLQQALLREEHAR